MKITDVRVVAGSEGIRASRPWRTGLPNRPIRQHPGFLEILTSDGVTGRCLVSDAVGARRLVENHLAEELTGCDPLAREALWHRIWEVNRLAYLPTPWLGMVDIALWDLAGKVAELPVYQLLGHAREEIPAYASTVTFGSIEEYLDVADQCLALGYSAIKLHAWGDARRDAELCLTLREHVGPGVALMFDGSAGYDLADAIYLGRALEEAEYVWYEEPMREFSVTSYRWLADRVGVPLLVAEITEGAHLNVGDFVASGAATYVRTSAGMKAGITGAMRIAHLADAFQLRAEVHGPGLPNEHLCMAIANTTYYESLIEQNPVVSDPRLDARARLLAPSMPGVGWPDLV